VQEWNKTVAQFEISLLRNTRKISKSCYENQNFMVGEWQEQWNPTPFMHKNGEENKTQIQINNL